MDATNTAAIISASAGLIGVVLGTFSVALKEYIVARRARKADTLYLGILVVSHLERFTNGCVQVAQDDGTTEGRPAGKDRTQHAVTTTPPEFLPLSLMVNWKVLPAGLLYPILRLPDEQENLNAEASSTKEYTADYPEHTEFFWVRRKGYAELGLQAIELAKELRAHCGIPTEQVVPGAWGNAQTLRAIVEDIDKRRTDHERRQKGDALSPP